MKEKLIQYIDLLFAGTDGAEDIRDEILQNTLDRYEDLLEQGRSPEDAYRRAIAGIGNLDDILGRSREAHAAKMPAVYEVPGIPVSRIIRAFAVGLYIVCLVPTILLDFAPLGSLGFIGTLLIVAAATGLLILFPKKKTPEAAAQEPSIPMPEPSVIRMIRGLAIGMYILCFVPVLLFSGFGWDNLGVCLMLMMIAAATVLIMIYRKPKESAPVQEERSPSTPQKELKKSIVKLIDSAGLVLYFIISFSTGAWHITWLIFLMMPAIRGLVTAVLDLIGE